MKPLTANNARALLDRIDAARGGELRSITMLDPTTFRVTFSVQDRNREFDWVDITFELTGVSDARLTDDDKLDLVDMDEGITVMFENGKCALAIGDYASLTAVSDATMYLIGTSMKYEESAFSG
jgi:hypothetical protein